MEHDVSEAAPSATPETDALLEVVVVSVEDQRPVPGVSLVVVTAESSGWRGHDVEGNAGGPEEIVRTDESGKARFHLAPGGYRVHTASFDGDVERTSVEVPFLVAGSRESIVFHVRTRPDRTVFGLVVDGDTEVPIAGASVRMLDQREVFEALSARIDVPVVGSTNPMGFFEVEAATWKETFARIEAPGYAFAVAGLRNLSLSSLEPSRILMHRGAVLLVNVEHEGVWRAGLTVRAEANGNQLLQHCDDRMRFVGPFRMARELQTDSYGSCRFDGLPSGVPLKVEVLERGAVVWRALEDPVLRPGAMTVVDVRIGTGCRIEGLALNQEREPAARMHLWLVPAKEAEGDPAASTRVFKNHEKGGVVQTARTDGKGRFVLEDVASGSWWIGPRPPEKSLARPSPSAASPVASLVTIAIGETSKEVTLDVYQGLFICGRVLWPCPPPTEGIGQVSAWSEQANFDDDFDPTGGSFALGPLVAGEYQVTASFFGFVASEPVLARPGDEDVILHLRSGGAISGQIVGADEEQFDGWLVVVSRLGLPSWSATRIDSQGAFELRGIEPGIYDLLAETDRGRVGYLRDISVDVDSECLDLLIELQPSATLLCRIEGDVTGIRAYQEDELVGVEIGDPSSPCKLRLPTGISLVCYGPSDRDPNEWSDSLSVDLSPGEEREVVLRVESP
jgi:hypothetical protein